jgi:hypothetical protein
VNNEGTRFIECDYWSGQMMLEFYNELQSGKGPVFLKLNHLSEIDRSGVDRLEKRRAERELRPSNLVADCLELGFESAFCLEQDDIAVLLVANTDHFVFGACRSGAEVEGDGAQSQCTEGPASHDHSSILSYLSGSGVA